MAAIASYDKPDVGRPACAGFHSFLPNAPRHWSQLLVGLPCSRRHDSRLLFSIPLVVLLLLLSPPFCPTCSHNNSGGLSVHLTALLFPGSSFMCEALILRGDPSRCGNASSIRNTTVGAYSHQATFIPHNLTFGRKSPQANVILASASHSPCNTTGRSRCTTVGREPVGSGNMTSKPRSLTGCYAYPLTFGKDEEPGRVALVTGASRGIGKTIAETLAEGGVAHVLCVARNQAACEEVASSLVARGWSASGHGVDVGDGAAVERLCSTLLEKYPRIDILVNNAGITRDNLFIRMSPQEWHDVINVNLNSAFYFTSPLIKRMVKNKFGRIINMSSVVGVGGNPGQANYAASKAGLIGMTRSLGKEYANRGITVNAIAPGFIRSAMTDAMTDAAKDATLARIPAARLGEPQDVANMVAFLASDQAAYVTGKVFPVDGGMLFGGN